MLIGVPGSGKSTWIRNHRHDAVVLSTDDYIDRAASAAGLTYSQAFADHIKPATADMQAQYKQAIKDRRDIIWDQTNLTKKSRRGKLSGLPKAYEKIALYFPTPDAEELSKRLDSRPGKVIPADVLRRMTADLEPPEADEGFDEIYMVPSGS